MAAAALCSIALAAVLPAAASAWSLGSNLSSTPDFGLCPVPFGATEASCTYAQLNLEDGHRASRGILAADHGVITRWKVESGPAEPGTAEVSLRLRVMRAGRSVPGAHSSFVDLPLARPGAHRFPARIPIDPGQEVALDTIVTSDGSGLAAAPIAHLESGIGEVGEWIPPLGEAEKRIPSGYGSDVELLLQAVVEPDRDHDGFGDATQDECPTDPRRHAPCVADRTRPRLEVFFAEHQDFLGTRRVVVEVRANEAVRAYASSQLDLPNATWGLDATRRRVPRGEVASLVMHLPPRPRRAGERALANGRRIYVRVFVSATDTSGNRTQLKAIRIKP